MEADYRRSRRQLRNSVRERRRRVNYYETSYSIARLQGQFFRAVERGDAASALVSCARFLWLGANPLTNLRFWREILRRGFSATYADGVRGAIDGLAESDKRASG